MLENSHFFRLNLQQLLDFAAIPLLSGKYLKLKMFLNFCNQLSKVARIKVGIVACTTRGIAYNIRPKPNICLIQLSFSFSCIHKSQNVKIYD